MKKTINNYIIISSVIIILVILTLLYIKLYKIDTFDTNPLTTNPLTTNPLTTNPLTTKPQPIDRTILYGSLFLENIDKTIKNLSNPDIKYEDKRIELNNYSDILF